MATTTASPFMMGAEAVSGLANAFSAYQSGKIARTGYWLQEQAMRRNAEIADIRAQNAIDRGNQAASQQRVKTRQLAGTQRAALASSGVDLTQGSPLRILTDTLYMGARDEAQILDNAQLEAQAARFESLGLSAQADMAAYQARSTSPSLAAATSLLSSAGQVADRWYRYSKTEG